MPGGQTPCRARNTVVDQRIFLRMIDVLMTPSKAYRGRCDHQLLAAGREHPKNSRKRAPGLLRNPGSNYPGPTNRRAQTHQGTTDLAAGRRHATLSPSVTRFMPCGPATTVAN